MFGLGVTIRGPRVYVFIGKHTHVPGVVSEEWGGGGGTLSRTGRRRSY